MLIQLVNANKLILMGRKCRFLTATQDRPKKRHRFRGHILPHNLHEFSFEEYCSLCPGIDKRSINVQFTKDTQLSKDLGDCRMSISSLCVSLLIELPRQRSRSKICTVNSRACACADPLHFYDLAPFLLHHLLEAAAVSSSLLQKLLPAAGS